jgi:Uma2 family endonuclease
MPATAIRRPRATPVQTPEGFPAHEMRAHRFTVEQYHRMIDTGILREDDRCELIHGWIVEKMPPNPPHSKSTRRVARRLMAMFPEEDWVVGRPQPITLSDSQPEPDFAAAVGPEERYNGRHPGPKDVVLVVEVSDSSVAFDTTTKLALYAGEKIPQYWVVNVGERRVEVYTDPRGGKAPTYRTRDVYAAGQSVPVTIAGKTLGSIPVSELLP